MNLPFLALTGLFLIFACLNALVLLDLRNADAPLKDLIVQAVLTDFSAIATATFFVLAVLA